MLETAHGSTTGSKGYAKHWELYVAYSARRDREGPESNHQGEGGTDGAEVLGREVSRVSGKKAGCMRFANSGKKSECLTYEASKSRERNESIDTIKEKIANYSYLLLDT